jgi:hypothetical protein
MSFGLHAPEPGGGGLRASPINHGRVHYSILIKRGRRGGGEEIKRFWFNA